MIAPDSKGYPFLGISQRFDVPYDAVLVAADATRQIRFGHTSPIHNRPDLPLLPLEGSHQVLEEIERAVEQQERIRKGEESPWD